MKRRCWNRSQIICFLKNKLNHVNTVYAESTVMEIIIKFIKLFARSYADKIFQNVSYFFNNISRSFYKVCHFKFHKGCRL